jgi:hypothetical protein
MPQKSSSKKLKYPKIVNKNKAVCRAVSMLPVSSSNRLPAVYVKSLPMVMGVITIFILLIIPSSRNHFFIKTSELASYLNLSLRAGVSAYVYQVKNNIDILPIDSDLNSKQYLGRVEVNNLKPVQTKTLAENVHMVQASIIHSFNNLK